MSKKNLAKVTDRKNGKSNFYYDRFSKSMNHRLPQLIDLLTTYQFESGSTCNHLYLARRNPTPNFIISKI